jgi:hypothetical protein
VLRDACWLSQSGVAASLKPQHDVRVPQPEGRQTVLDEANGLLRKAERFEKLMRMTDDTRALRALHDLARAYRAYANDLIDRQHTHDIWRQPNRRLA